MPSPAAERVAEYVRDRIEDGLRTVSAIDGDTIDLVYLRDDLRDDYDPNRYARVTSLFQEMPSIEDARLIGQPVGQREAVLHYHENAFVLQLPYTDSTTVIVSVEPDVGRDLLGFIEECRRITRGTA